MGSLIKIFSLVLMFLLTGCMGDPMDVVDDALHCVKKGHYKDFIEYVDPKDYAGIISESNGPADLDEEAQKKWVSAVIESKMSAEMKKLKGIKSYNVYKQTLYETMSESGVNVDIVYGNGKKDRVEFKMKKVDDKWYFILY